MPMTDALRVAGILRAEEISMLAQVYQELAAEPFIASDNVGREALAAHILVRYQTGTTDPVTLKAACREQLKL